MAESSISGSLRRRIFGIFHFSSPTLVPVLPVLIPEELVWEILSWLPVKSLLRFKCVSRIWRSIITNPSFAKAHRVANRGLLICAPNRLHCRLAPKRCFYLASPLDISLTTSQLSRYLTLDHGGSDMMGYTDIVNGLVCFYSGNHSYLYNIATRESLQLPVSVHESKACSYHLGFDPVNKFYKLLKICPVYEGWDEDDRRFSYDDGALFVRNLKCEILTLGVDSSWRIVHSLPPMEIRSSGACFDGVLYWMEEFGALSDRLVAFDLAEEKFQFIPLPPPSLGYGYALPQFSGTGLALFHMHEYGGVGKVSIFRYRPMTSGWMWVKELIFNLPLVTSHFSPKGILPNGNVVLYCFHPSNYGLHLFDPTKRVLEKIKIDITFDRCDRCPVSIGIHHPLYFEENIIPLRCLTPSA